jgi:hypothetical protein
VEQRAQRAYQQLHAQGGVDNAEAWETPEALAAWRSEANAPDPGVELLDVRMHKFDATTVGA